MCSSPFLEKFPRVEDIINMATLAGRPRYHVLNRKISAGGLPLRQNIQAPVSSAAMAPICPADPVPISQQNVRSMYTSISHNDYGTLFNDPQNVRQWAVSSANGSGQVIDDTHPGFSDMNYSNDACYDSFRTGRDVRYPRASQISTFSVLPSDPSMMQESSLSQAIPDGLYETCPTTVAAVVKGARFLNSDFVDARESMMDYSGCDTWIPNEIACHGSLFPTHVTLDSSVDTYQPVTSAYIEKSPLPATWPSEQPFVEECFSDCLNVDSSEAWSPSALAMDASLSSSYSQSSYTLKHDESPHSYGSQEDLGQVSYQDYSMSPLDTDGHANFPYIMDPFENSSDSTRFVSITSLDMPILTILHSTLRPVRICQRPSLATAIPFHEQDPAHYLSNMANPWGDAIVRRDSSGEEAKCNARRDQLYKLGPKKDGLYHCPFPANCSHKPDKLKCNYE